MIQCKSPITWNEASLSTLFRQAVRGILCFRRDMISEEIRFVDIAVASFSREALFVMFVYSIFC